MRGFKLTWTRLEDRRLTSLHGNKFVGSCGGRGQRGRTGGGEGRNSVLPWRLPH